MGELDDEIKTLPSRLPFPALGREQLWKGGALSSLTGAAGVSPWVRLVAVHDLAALVHKPRGKPLLAFDWCDCDTWLLLAFRLFSTNFHPFLFLPFQVL